jgi:hypothetical protein
MDTTTLGGSPLRQRRIEDMRMRKLEPRTQEGCIRAVRKLTVNLERSPDTLNATLIGLKFYFDSGGQSHASRSSFFMRLRTIGSAGASLRPASVTMAKRAVAFNAGLIASSARSGPAARMAIRMASV